MKVLPVPCLRDNYAYLVVCEATGHAGVVDPSEAEPVAEAVRREGVELKAILNTHHHHDHVGGNQGLLGQFKGLKVYAHESDGRRIPGLTDGMPHEGGFTLGEIEFRTLHNPGHTTGGLSYVADGCVFTGDTMFAAGCGRLFEGTAENMHTSLCRTIGGLPEDTRVYFGHEYTERNLQFAAHVEPDNQAVHDKLAMVRRLRAGGLFTTPSVLSEEWQTNPFMRSDSSTIQQKVREAEPGNDLSPVAVLAAVRRMKDAF